MKIFVTGATGFLGRNFLEYALRVGHEVVAVCRVKKGIYEALGLTWIESQLDSLPRECMTGCDALVHFAAAGVSPKMASQHELTYWNVEVPLGLLKLASECGVRRAVLAGSYSEYGHSASHYEFIPPDAPLFPIDAYAASKAACFVSSYAATIGLGLEFCYLRVFSAYGEGQFDGNFWPSLRRAALNGDDFNMSPGAQIRDFIEVNKVSHEFLYALMRNDIQVKRPMVWNIGSGNPVSISEFAEYWWQYFNASGELRIGALPYRTNEMMRYVPLITESSKLSGVLI
jgi:nucleoside-diphosphate-sugar epimerase